MHNKHIEMLIFISLDIEISISDKYGKCYVQLVAQINIARRQYISKKLNNSNFLVDNCNRDATKTTTLLMQPTVLTL